MGSKTEDWWVHNYPKYSLKDFESMSVYQKFKTCSDFYSKGDHNFREAYWKDENCYILEWYDRRYQTGEKFGIDHNSYTYFFEHWYIDEDAHVIEKSWLQNQNEWGVIIHFYPDCEKTVTWSTDPQGKVLEMKTKKSDQVESEKIGKKYTHEGIEDFTEKFWETASEKRLEKNWKKGTAEGEEKKFEKGEEHWGESWVQDKEYFKKDEWHEDGKKKWGMAEGQNGSEFWQADWEKDSDNSFEERKYRNSEKEWGTMRSKSTGAAFTLDWEGEKPEITDPRNKKTAMAKPKAKQLRSAHPDNEKLLMRKGTTIKPIKINEESEKAQSDDEGKSPTKISDIEQLGFSIGNLFSDLKADLLNRVFSLTDPKNPLETSESIKEILKSIKDLKDPKAFDANSAIQSIRELRNISKDLQVLEDSMRESLPTTEQLARAFADMITTGNSLQSLLDSSNETGFEQESQRLSKEFSKAASIQEKVSLTSAVNPLIRDMLNLQKQKLQDLDREAAEITHKLSEYLLDFKEIIKESQHTLEKIEKNFKPNDESIAFYHNAYLERATEIVNGIERSIPYTKVLPKFTGLLIDMEKFKRESMDTDMNKTLLRLAQDIQEISEDLAEALQVPLEVLRIEKVRDLDKDLSGLVDCVKDRENVMKALVKKFLGKDAKCGIAEVDSIKPRDLTENHIGVDVKGLLKFIWVNGKAGQDATTEMINALLEDFGTNTDKTMAGELFEKGQHLVTGIVSESNSVVLEQIQSTVQELLPLLASQDSLLDELMKKCIAKAKSADVKLETLEELWKAIMLSDKISEKIITEPSSLLEDLRKTIDQLPAKPDVSLLHKNIVKYQEVNLGLLNQNKDLTAEEIKEIEIAAKKRAGGKVALMKNKKKALRSGKGGIRKLDVSEPASETIEKSFKTASDLALWVLGPRPAVSRHIEELNLEKDPILKSIQQNGGSEEAIDKVFSLLQKYEDEKIVLFTKSDIIKNFLLILQKCQGVLETTSKFLNVPIPGEIDELKKKVPSGDLTDYTKRVGFYLSIFFKMVKEATGVDDGNEDLNEAMGMLLKKQAISMLPFDPLQLLHDLKEKNNTDVRRLRFLAGLVGSESEVVMCAELENKAKFMLDEFNPRDTQEAMGNIDVYLHNYPGIEQEITGATENMLNTLVERLTHPEPLESDVSKLISTTEKLDLALKKLGKIAQKTLNSDELAQRKEELPTSSVDLIPYLTGLVDDYSETNLLLVSELVKSPFTGEERKKLESAIGKKVKAAPVLILREVQHLFAGPSTENMINIIVKLNQTSEILLRTHSVVDPFLYSECKEKYLKLDRLFPYQIKTLGIDYCDVILGMIDISGNFEDFMSFIEETNANILRSRCDSKLEATVTWDDIFKSRGLDIDGELLCQSIQDEQKVAKAYLETFPNSFGSTEQKIQIKSLLAKSEEILNDPDAANVIVNYVQLRLEESKVMGNLCQKLQNLTERLEKLDMERANFLNSGFSEVGILVEKNNPSLKSQLEVLFEKENNYKDQGLENISERVLRITNRLGLEKELNRIKEEANPKDNSEGEIIKNLSEIQEKVFKVLREEFAVLCEYSNEINPEDHSNLKLLTEISVATTIPALLGSIHIGLDSTFLMFKVFSQSLSSTPIRKLLEDIEKTLVEEAGVDDIDTEIVFSGLFRLCGSFEDKQAAKKLREARSLSLETRSPLIALTSLLEFQLKKLHPTRSLQSKLQVKLVKEAGNMREGIDDIDLMTEDLLTKAAREVSNTIMPDDLNSKKTLDTIRKALESINENSPTNIPDIIERVVKRLENWEKLERLRKDLRERLSKEINRLRGDVQDKSNEIETAHATLEGLKAQFEAQITLLQNISDQNIGLIEKLTQEATEKEKQLSDSKSRVAVLQSENERLQEDLQRLQDEVDSNTKEVRSLRRMNKEKEAQLRDLQNSLDGLERNNEKSSLGDKEKNEVMERMKAEAKGLRDEIAAKHKFIDDLEEKCAMQDRNIQKLDLEIREKDQELDLLRKEKSQLKAAILKLETEKTELEELAKISEGVNPEEIKHLERILVEKQNEIDELKENLQTARRYQLLYVDLTTEKQEIESKLREALIDNSDYKLKVDELKQENDQIKYKTRALDQLQKDFAALQKENQKLQMRLSFLEKSDEKSEEIAGLANKLSNEINDLASQRDDLSKEIERLKAELLGAKKKYELSLSRGFLVRLCHVFKEMQGQSMRKWANFRKPQAKVLEITSCSQVPAIEIEEEAEFIKDYAAADQILQEENLELISLNPIMINYKSIEGKSEKPMSYINVFKFLEEVMDKKFETDKKDIADLRQMRSMTEFIMEHLTRSFGINSLALKFLGQFIPGFHEIYMENHQYAIFFARLLQVFHPDPVSYSLSLYLVRVRMQFHPLIEKYERFMNDQGKKQVASKKKGDTYGRSAYEAAGTGGKALLCDVIELIYNIFTGDRESGVKALELLKPAEASHEDFVAFKICHKMAKLGKTPEMIFTMLDKDGGGTIDANEFITGTKEDLDLWISDKNIEKLMKKMDLDGNGEIAKEEFMNRINMKVLMEWNKNPLWTVTKACFLITLVEVHKFKQRKLTAHLNPAFARYGKSALSKNEFSELISSYDSTINPSDMEKLYDESLRIDSNGATFKCITAVISKYCFGDLKSFRVRELIQELSQRKTVIDINVNDESKLGRIRSSTRNDESKVDREEEITIRKKIVKKIIKK